ncbi:caspase, EACC1-associated type [Actinoplanes regularis]|uniref:caspase, EACC1-associated type n=1 Tax=Actinoplanes regularis TaxID=52697 RepID=UPI0024A47F74|nr:caspase family protein [Actinoplanes regularis]GLW29085.1 hypothetical protein Areg01_20250 [Actinoplanes regularis]
MTGRRLALLIAVDTYLNPGLSQLYAPLVDAAALADVLGDESLGGFTVEISHNESTEDITGRIENLLADLIADDTVLLHFAGHGLRSDENELYLAATNTRPDRLLTTGIDSRLVSRLIRRSRAGSVVLLLDCCYGAAFAKDFVGRAGDEVDVGSRFRVDDLSGGRGYVVITAARETEFAVESGGAVETTGGRSSVFTEALIHGIATGEADFDQDGRVAVNELYEYVYHRVRAARPQQTPNKWEFGVRGGLFVSHSPRRRILPAVLPPHLRELLDDDRSTARQVAVHELVELLDAGDLPLAATARATLEKLVGDDSRKVSAAAAAALGESAISLAVAEVDLGVLAGRTGRRTIDVPIGGGPLALASSVRPAAGIRARIVDGVLRVAISESRPGPVDTVLTISGLAGEAELRVRGYVALSPRHAADSAAVIAREPTDDPIEQVVRLIAAGWAAFVTGSHGDAMALLAAAEEAAQRIPEYELHFGALTAIHWIGARCGDERRSVQVLDNVAALIRTLLLEPADRAAALAALAWLGHLAKPPAAGEHPWTVALAGVVRAVAGPIGMSPRLDSLLPEADRTADAIESDETKTFIKILVDWCGALSGRQDRADRLLPRLADSVLGLDETPAFTAAILLPIVLAEVAAAAPATALAARPEDQLLLQAANEDLIAFVAGSRQIAADRDQVIAQVASLTAKLAEGSPLLSQLADALVLHLRGDAAGSARAVERVSTDDDAEVGRLPMLTALAAIQHAGGDSAAARASLGSAYAAAARVEDKTTLCLQLLLGSVVARLIGDDGIARHFALTAKDAAAQEDPAARSMAHVFAALASAAAGVGNNKLLKAAMADLKEISHPRARAMTLVLITWAGRRDAGAEWSQRLFDGLADAFETSAEGEKDDQHLSAVLLAVVALLAALSTAGQVADFPGSRLLAWLVGSHEDREHATVLFSRAMDAVKKLETNERLPAVLVLALAAHCLKAEDLRSTLLEEASALLGSTLNIYPAGCWAIRVGFAWIMTLVGEITVLPRTAEALLAHISDVDDDEEAALLLTLAALALAAAGQGDRAQQALVTAQTAITELDDPTGKAVLLALAAWAGTLVAD